MNELSAFVFHIISIYILPITYSLFGQIKNPEPVEKKYNHRWPDTILNDNNNFLLAHTLVSFFILCCLYQYFIYFHFSNIETFAAHLVSSVFIYIWSMCITSSSLLLYFMNAMDIFIFIIMGNVFKNRIIDRL